MKNIVDTRTGAVKKRPLTAQEASARAADEARAQVKVAARRQNKEIADLRAQAVYDLLEKLMEDSVGVPSVAQYLARR